MIDDAETRRPVRDATRVLRSPAVIFGLLTLLAFPILEIVLRGERARQFAADVFDGDLPALIGIRDDWLRFGPSLWDTHLTAGNATLAQLALPPSTPDFLLSFVIPPFVAYALTYAALIWVAGYGMYRFLHDSMRLVPMAALIGGAIYLFSFWHYIHGFAVPLLPLVLWTTDRWADADRGRWKYTSALVALATFGFYSGLLQLQLLVGALQGLYLIATRLRSGQLVGLLARYLGIWFAAAMLFMPVLITQVVYVGGSQRAIWDLDYLYHSALGPAVADTVTLFSNALIGIPIAGVTSGSAGYSGTFFLGGLGLVAILIGIIQAPRTPRSRLMLAMLVVVPFVYLIALLVTPIQALIPVLNSFQFIRVSHLYPFFLVVNAAIGLDVVLSGRVPARRLGAIGATVAVVVLALLAIEAALAASHAVDTRTRGWTYAVVGIAAGLVLGALLVWQTRARVTRGAIPAVVMALLLLVVIGERMTMTRADRLLHPGLGTYAGMMSVTPGMAFIAATPNADHGRTLTAGEHPNRMLVAGLDEAGGYQSIYPLGYHRLYGALTAPYLETDPVRRAYFERWGNRAYVFGPGLDPELLDLMGIRWIYSKGMDLRAPDREVVFESGDVTVYENTGLLPRAFVAGDVQTFETVDALTQGLASADRGALRSTAFVLDRARTGSTIPDIGPFDPDGTATITEYRPDRVRIETSVANPGLLILTDVMAPGWTATVNGASVPVATVDLAYRAVPVPAGTSTVVFEYRPWFTYAGIAVSIVTLVGLVALGVVVRRRARP